MNSDLKGDNNGRISSKRVYVWVGGICESRELNQDIKRKRNTRRELQVRENYCLRTLSHGEVI